MTSIATEFQFLGGPSGATAPGQPVLRSAPVKSGASSPPDLSSLNTKEGALAAYGPSIFQRNPVGGGGGFSNGNGPFGGLANRGFMPVSDPGILSQLGGGGNPSFGYTARPIDGSNPSLRGKEIGFNVPTQTFNPMTMQGPQGLNFGGFSVDPSSFGGSVSSGGGGFNVNAKSVQDQAMKTFFSQLPQMNINFGDEVEGLAKRTAAMGRTGSGLFNRDTDLMSGRQLAAREALLGNIGLQAATTDAGNDLQAQMATGGFDQAAKQRAMQASMANASNGLQAALQNAQMNMQGQMFDIGNQMSVDQFNTGMLNDAGLWNAQNRQNMGLAGLQHTLGERGYQDQLAGQAQNDLAAQMGFLQGGFSGSPAQYALGAAGGLGNLAGMFGSNAAQTSAGMGGMGQSIAQLLAGQGGGGGGGIGDLLGGLFGGGGGGAIQNALAGLFGNSPGATASMGSGIAAPMLAGIF